MSMSGVVSGVALVILGVFLAGLAFFTVEGKVGTIVLGIYGLIALSVGIYMLVNSDKEDLIELIKMKKNKRT